MLAQVISCTLREQKWLGIETFKSILEGMWVSLSAAVALAGFVESIFSVWLNFKAIVPSDHYSSRVSVPTFEFPN